MGNHTVTTNSVVTCHSMEEDSNRSLEHTPKTTALNGEKPNNNRTSA